MNSSDITRVYQQADCLYDDKQVQQALDAMAVKISEDMADSMPVILCVMTGAIIPMGHLLTRLDFPLTIDYIHATRYQGKTSGGELNWLHEPATDLRDRVVLIIDDILDEGVTLKAIVEYCQQRGASKVFTAVLVDKIHERKAGLNADYIGLRVEDRYVFGYGMDYHDYLRNAPGIFAVKGM